MNMEASIKMKAQQLVEQLPEHATWEDLLQEIHVRQSIEKGLDDSEHDRVQTIETVRKRYGL